MRDLILESELMAKAQMFEDFAYSTEQRNRVLGSPGLNSSLQYVLDTLNSLNYYDVTTQYFNIPQATSTLSVDGTTYRSAAFNFAPAGKIDAPLVIVPNLACNAVSLKNNGCL